MPVVSEPQRKAMFAALGGHSTLGIPKSVAEKFVGKNAHDMSDEDWNSLRSELSKFINVDELSLDPNSAIPVVKKPKPKIEYEIRVGAHDRFAFDRESVRSFDKDGHLHISVANISKANVCPYRGREIPDWQGLRLDPEKIYKLYRDPEELARGAATFHGKPLLITHKATNAENHPRDLTVGTIMNPRFEDPYLKAELAVWDAEAIEGIEDDSNRELSAGYRYRADMTPGSVNGEPYDGVMRDIMANHQALVPEGRAGPDVIVGDSKLKVNQSISGSWLL